MLFDRNLIDTKRKHSLLSFQKHAGLTFQSLDLLDLALQHRSVMKSKSAIGKNNERLEFLGDAVLDLVISTYLYQNFPKLGEGELSKRKAVLVSANVLSQIALNLNISSYLLLGKGEEMTGGRKKKNVLADALEAVIGALYLDQGLSAVEHFVMRLIIPYLNTTHMVYQDAKSRLQELSQEYLHCLPTYTLIKTEGPEHNKTFWTEISINSTVYGAGQGKSKKESEQVAAQEAIKQFLRSRA